MDDPEAAQDGMFQILVSNVIYLTVNSVHNHENSINPFDNEDDTAYNQGFMTDDITHENIHQPPPSNAISRDT